MLPDDSWLNAFITLLVILDPAGLIPIFLGLTAEMSQNERRQTAIIASFLSFGILATFTLAGLQILAILGISFGAFRIAGGILLFFIAFEMIFEKRIERKKKTVKVAITRGHIRNIAAFPLAIPLLAGPGTISATILMARKHYNLYGVISTLLVVLGAILIAYLFMRMASPIEKLLGETGRSIVTRLFGVLLAALAIQFIADGMNNLFRPS
ncbi:MAG: multiple antibiotic resistance protein [Candidatus Tokpelaia sp. JSC161]|jgi:multiple antibiotic resistance protein|nr:MAG: multiple antibiotic resistance protein [Candidatus Tokpelaia sp. JSC161]